jgi:hypothetical protein
MRGEPCRAYLLTALHFWPIGRGGEEGYVMRGEPCVSSCDPRGKLAMHCNFSPHEGERRGGVRDEGRALCDLWC